MCSLFLRTGFVSVHTQYFGISFSHSIISVISFMDSPIGKDLLFLFLWPEIWVYLSLSLSCFYVALHCWGEMKERVKKNKYYPHIILIGTSFSDSSNQRQRFSHEWGLPWSENDNQKRKTKVGKWSFLYAHQLKSMSFSSPLELFFM